MNWRAAAILGISVLLSVVVYFPAMPGPFVFDDLNQYYSTPPPLRVPWQAWVLGARPLLQLSFYTTYLVAGNNPFAYHFVNAVLHGINAFLVMLVIRRVLAIFEPSRSAFITAASLMGAALFLLHPVQTEAVAYASSRSEVLSALGFLLSLEAFLRFRQAAITWLRALWIGFTFLFALGCKEHVAVLPGVFLAAEFLAHDRWPSVKKSGVWRLYGLLIVLGSAGALYLYSYLRADPSLGVGGGTGTVRWFEYMYSQWPIFWRYIGLIVLPWNLNADYDLPVLRSPMDGGAVIFFVVLLALFAWFVKFSLTRLRAGLLGIILSVLVLLPTSSIVPIKDLMADRRLYLPMAGIAILAAAALVRLPLDRFSYKVVGAAAAACLTAMTLSRATVWGNPIEFWKDTAEKSAGKFRPRFWLGEAYLKAGRCREASAAFDTAVKLPHDPDSSIETHQAMAFDCLGNYPAAIRAIDRALQIDGATADELVLRATYLAKINQLPAAFRDLEQALAQNPQSLGALSTRGLIFAATGRFQEALPDLEKAVALAPADPKINQALVEVRRRVAASQ